MARAKDDAELAKLVNDVEALFADLKNMDEQGQIPGGTITDLMQHRIQPLMVRAAEIGQLPSALFTCGMAIYQQLLGYKPALVEPR